MAGTTFFLDQGETLGGAERFLLDFFQNLRSVEIKRIRPIIVGAKNEQYKKCLPEGILNVYWEYTSVRGGFFKKPFILLCLIHNAWKLKALAKQQKATTFFSNTPRTHFVMFLAKKLFFLRGKWIVMNHDFTVPRLLLRSIAKKADILIANSIPCREYLRSHIRSNDFKKIRIIENGICLDSISKNDPPQRIERILILGRIDPRKGQMFALKAAEILQEHHPLLKFYIVGSPFEEDPRTIYYFQHLKQFIREKRLENVVLQSETKSPFEAMKKADCILALPTEPETFGRIVIEGLALNKLVLAFNETGPREILKNFEQFCGIQSSTSLLIEKQNALSLAERIAFFVEHPQEFKKFISLGRAFVEKNFSLEESKKRMTNILLEN